MKILPPGGAGYIGSHTIIELYKAGHSVVVVDNLVNSNQEALRRVSKIIGEEFPFEKADIRDRDRLDHIFGQYKIDAVVSLLQKNVQKDNAQIHMDGQNLCSNRYLSMFRKQILNGM